MESVSSVGPSSDPESTAARALSRSPREGDEEFQFDDLDEFCVDLGWGKYITWRSLFSGFNLWIIIDQLQLVFKVRIAVGILHTHTNFAKTTPQLPKVKIRPIHVLNTIALIRMTTQFSNM